MAILRARQSVCIGTASRLNVAIISNISLISIIAFVAIMPRWVSLQGIVCLLPAVVILLTALNEVMSLSLVPARREGFA